MYNIRNQVLLITYYNLPKKFHKNSSTSFWVILLTDILTDRQPNGRESITSLAEISDHNNKLYILYVCHRSKESKTTDLGPWQLEMLYQKWSLQGRRQLHWSRSSSPPAQSTLSNVGNGQYLYTGCTLFFNIDFSWHFHDHKMKIHDLSAQHIFPSKQCTTYECILSK